MAHRNFLTRSTLVGLIISLFVSVFVAPGCGVPPAGSERPPQGLREATGGDQGGDQGGERDARPTPEASAERKEGLRGAFLYRIDGGAEPSYLLGTIHLGVALEESLEPSELQALASTRAVYTELASDVDMAAVAMKFFLGEHEELAALIGHERFKRLAARVPSLPEVYLGRLKPWAALVFAGVAEYQRYLEANAIDPEVSMDTELQTLAAAEGIPNLGLESAEDQLAAFEAISLESVIALLDELLEKPIFEEAKTLLGAYRAGDTDALLEALDMDSARERAPAYYDQLLRERNQRWMHTLLPELKRGGIVIGVGAAHLFYDDGLIKLFNEAGYRTEKLR